MKLLQANKTLAEPNLISREGFDWSGGHSGEEGASGAYLSPSDPGSRRSTRPTTAYKRYSRLGDPLDDCIVLALSMIASHTLVSDGERNTARLLMLSADDGSRKYYMLLQKGKNIAGL